MTEQIFRRLVAQWRYKAALSVALTLLFSGPYFALQHVDVRPAQRLPLTPLDLAVPFQPGWVWVYQSIYLLMGPVAWLAPSREALTRYARGFLVLSYTGFAVFAAWPVIGPRPDAPATDPMLRLLLAYDAPLNSFPSLHVGLAVYTALMAAHLLDGQVSRPARRAALAALTAWCLAIAFSTVAIRQHYVVDLPAGALLAWLAFRWAFRSAPSASVPAPVSPPSVTVRSSPVSEGSTHAEAPAARVPDGRLHPDWSAHPRVGAAAAASRGGSGAGRGGSRGAAPVEDGLRAGRS